MRLALSRVPLLAVIVLLVATLAPGYLIARAQDDASRFADVLAARANTPSLAGPLSGELVQAQGFSTVAGAGISATDFTASATFVNPPQATTPWDIGFGFHRTATSIEQIVVTSDAAWFFTPFPAGVVSSGFAPSFNAAPGGANTLDLVVEGTNALFGLNGQFLTRVPLSPPVAADVEVGTGFFGGASVPGRAIAFGNFQVWPLPGAAPQIETPVGPTPPVPLEPTLTPLVTPAPEIQETVTPEPTPAVSSADAELFASLLASQLQATPLAGPFTANLKEFPEQVATSWAGVNLADFHAQATFMVPQTVSDVPWNIGFMFKTSPSGTLRVSADSLGNAWFSIGPLPPLLTGTVGQLNTGPGETNTLDLLVAGQRALFGVNGSLIAAIDLPADATAADVAAGSAFFSDQNVTDRVTRYHDFVIVPLSPDALGAAVTPIATPIAADASDFDARLAEIEQMTPIAGPFSGRLVEATAGTVPLAAAGVALADFGVMASFSNPADPSLGRWDHGFQFRTSGTTTNRIVVNSLGDVVALPAGQDGIWLGNAATYNPAPGASNAIQLFVVGQRALVGVNGAFIAAVDLTAPPAPSDVQAATAIFTDDFVAGRVTDYQDFRVWELT
jgi:hypothetical protein